MHYSNRIKKGLSRGETRDTTHDLNGNKKILARRSVRHHMLLERNFKMRRRALGLRAWGPGRDEATLKAARRGRSHVGGEAALGAKATPRAEAAPGGTTSRTEGHTGGTALSRGLPRTPGEGSASAAAGRGHARAEGRAQPGRPRKSRACAGGRGGERGGRRGELATGLTDGSNRSPGSTLGQGERWGEVEEREGGYCVGKRKWGRERAWGAGAPRPRAQGRAGPWFGPTSLNSISPASNQDHSANRTPKLDEHTPRHNIRQNKYASA
jgi:hypothetical protein